MGHHQYDIQLSTISCDGLYLWKVFQRIQNNE